MAELPVFEAAVEQLTAFLSGRGHPVALVWVFRDDAWLRYPRDAVIGWPVRPGAPALAKQVYEQGRLRGIVGVDAIAQAPQMTFATVWFPKFPEDEVQGWSRNLKVTIQDPLLRAKLVSRLAWFAIRCTPSYRRYQRSSQFIGTRRWAGAA
jgi:hypothetical protein